MKEAGLNQRPGDARIYFESDEAQKSRETVLSASICFDKLAGALNLDQDTHEASQAAVNYKKLQGILVRWIDALESRVNDGEELRSVSNFWRFWAKSAKM